MLLRKKKPPEPKPAFSGKLLEKDPLKLSESGKADAIYCFIEENKAPLDKELQDNLAERFYKSVHDKAVLRLLGPISIPCVATIILKELECGISQVHLAIGFAIALFSAATYGRRRSIEYENSMSKKAAAMIGSEAFQSQAAQERLCNVVSEGEDGESAYNLLSGRMLTSISAQIALSNVIYRHGTAEQARKLLEQNRLNDMAESMLRLKAGD